MNEQIQEQKAGTKHPEFVLHSSDPQKHDRSKTSRRLKLLVVLTIGVLPIVLFSACTAVVAYALYSEGLFDRAPALPSYARPAEARQLHNEKQSCYQTDDFGPYSRYAVFGTHATFAAAMDPIINELRERGWRADYDDPLLRNRFAYVGASRGDISMSYFHVDPDALSWPAADKRERAREYETVIEVYVTDRGDCPI
jgi:hypothetical protein